MLPALVLTAGLGTRLDPITRLVAKPAVPLGDATLVEIVLGQLRDAGTTDVVLNLHHRPSSVTSIVGDGHHLGLRVRYSWEDPVLGSAGGPRHALPLLDAETFVIVNGDTLSDVDLPAMLAAHRELGGAVTLAVVPNAAPDRYNGLVLDSRGTVTGFAPRGRADGTWHFVGVQIVSSRVFADLADGEPAETISGLYRAMVAEKPGRIVGWRTTATFLDVGTPADYLAAAMTLGGRTTAQAGSIVWPGATIGQDVVIDQCIVAGPLALPSGFRASRAVVVPASVLQPGDRATVLGDIALFPLDTHL